MTETFIPKIDPKYRGIRGCRGRTKRRGSERMCAQPDVGGGYCWYHNPERPHRFGEGYRYEDKAPNDRTR